MARYSGNELLRTFIHAHVDDIKIIGDEVALVKAAISKHIKVIWKDGAEAKVFCGMEYARIPPAGRFYSICMRQSFLCSIYAKPAAST